MRLDPLSCLLPFLARHTSQVLFFYHTEVQIIGFGALMSSLFLGRFLASLCAAQLLPLQLYSHSILALVFFLIALSSRYILLLVACFLVGLFKDWSANPPQTLSHKEGRTRMMINAEEKSSLMYSAFAMIITGFLYRENATRFPALYSCLLTGLGFAAVAYIAFTRRGKRRSTKFSSLNHQLKNSPIPTTARHSVVATASNSLGASLQQRPQNEIQLSDVPLSSVPARYVKFWGSEAAAHKRYVDTLRWRQLHAMDSLLTRHQNYFAEILQFYPHAIHGRSKDGCVVLYEILGQARPAEMRKRGITSKDILWHMILRNEFVFQRCFNAGEEGEIMTVVDVKNVISSSFSFLSFLPFYNAYFYERRFEWQTYLSMLFLLSKRTLRSWTCTTQIE